MIIKPIKIFIMQLRNAVIESPSSEAKIYVLDAVAVQGTLKSLQPKILWNVFLGYPFY